MRNPNALKLLAALFVVPVAATGKETPHLAIAGKVVYENKLDAPVSAPWKVLKGKWELAEGTWRPSEIPADKHPGVARLSNKLGDFVIEYEFKWDGGKSTSLSINGPNGHMARISITPRQVSFQKDDSDHDGPDQAVVFAKIPMNFAADTWHKVRLEMVGDTMRGQVDEVTGFGKSDSFNAERTAGLTLGGQSLAFRNLKISEATLHPNWDSAVSNQRPAATKP